MSEPKHLVVIGAGPAGYAAAFRAADIGLKVTLIDAETNPGGVCLYRGCIPSKALLHVAKLVEEARSASDWGIGFPDPEIDVEKLRAWKDGVITRLTGGLGALAKSRKVEYIQGTARFIDAHTLNITRLDGADQSLVFDNAIVATGSRPSVIPALLPDSSRVMDSTQALALESIPPTLLVIGGGYIGLELATVYAALGSRVTVVEMLPALLTGADPDLVKVLSKRLSDRLEGILLETSVAEMSESDAGVAVRMEGKQAPGEEQVFDKILVSVGRQPNTEGLGLENTSVALDENGFIATDNQRRTAQSNVYAVGDVAGNPMLAHKGSHEAHLAAEVIAGEKVHWDPRAIPAVVFTDPEIAWCGLTESEARASGTAYKAVTFPWAASGRAIAMDRSEGLTKLLFEPDSKRLLGVGLVGSGAGELIAEGALAIEMSATAEDLALTIHPHPTMSETLMEAAELFLGRSDHFHRPGR